MSYDIRTVVDKERGCGWRKKGGFYMMGAGIGVTCCRLPIPLEVCPCCSQGIKPNRGFTWIDPKLILGVNPDPMDPWTCNGCPAGDGGDIGPRVGLIWIGEQFYKDPAHFDREAAAIGISRRLKQVPHGFKVGQTWVALAHRKAISEYMTFKLLPDFIKYRPGIFRIFRPDRIEYIVKGSESDPELQALADRGFDLVNVLHEGDQSQLFMDEINE